MTSLLAACGKAGLPLPSTQPPEVTVAKPIHQTVRDKIELDGIVAPSASVNLVARVAGYLQAAPFQEGDRVKRGELLFVVEPEPYRQQVKLNQARLDQARAEAERQTGLLKENATSQSSVENARSQLAQAEANLALADINLGYTEVRAPFDGLIGRRLVDVGNYVGASPGGTALATLQRIEPAYVNFSVGERDLLTVRQQRPASARGAKPEVGTLKVRVALQGESTPSEEGVLDFIDNNLDVSTGSMPLRARFANLDAHLLPGLYAKVSVNIGLPRVALLVPNVAMQSDQRGNYVFVLDGMGRARRVDVAVGSQFGALREVKSGLQEDAAVIVDGLVNVGDGTTVRLAARGDAGVKQ